MCQHSQDDNVSNASYTKDEADREARRRRAENNKRFLTYLVVGAMPFLYGGATRLPFIYFVIHLSVHFGLSWWRIGVCVGAYQCCRVIVNAGSIYAPRTAHFLGTVAGLAGYCTVYISDNDTVLRFVLGTAVIGLSETVACMQKYAKELFKRDVDRKKTQRMLKYQYASVMCGVMVSFSIGGVVYQHYSINGVAIFGMMIEGSALLVFFSYLAASHRRECAPSGSSAFIPATTKTPSPVPSITEADDPSSGTPPAVVRLTSRRKTKSHSRLTRILPDGSICQVAPLDCLEDLDNSSSSEHEETYGKYILSSGMQPSCDKNVDGDAAGSQRTGEEDQDIEAGLSTTAAGESGRVSRSPEGSEDQHTEVASTRSDNRVNQTPIDDANPTENVDKEGPVREEDKETEEVEDEEARPSSDIEEQNKNIESGPVEDHKATKEDPSNSSPTAMGLKNFDHDDIEECSLNDVFPESSRNMNSIIDHANANYHALNIPATWLNYLVCISFGIEALTIGYNLSIGPIFILTQFERDTGITGILFSIGAGLGSVLSILVTCTKSGKKVMHKIVKSPYDLCFAMGGIAFGVFVATVPFFPVHVAGVILLMAFNDLGATLLTEFQASITTASTYSVLGPLGQIVRRSLNVVTAVTGPILYGIYPSLPYLVAGSITLLWTVLLAVAFTLRMKGTVHRLSGETGRNDDSIRSLMSFQTMEVVRSVSMDLSVQSRDMSVSISSGSVTVGGAISTSEHTGQTASKQ